MSSSAEEAAQDSQATCLRAWEESGQDWDISGAASHNFSAENCLTQIIVTGRGMENLKEINVSNLVAGFTQLNWSTVGFSIASVSLEMNMDSQLKEEMLQIMLRVNLLQPKEIS